MTGQGDTPPGRARVAAEAALVLLAALAYLWLFRLYGFDVVDEGTQLAQIDRVAHGARPYVDFETGYTPGYFLLHVALWRATGAELLATRTFGVLLHAATIGAVFAAVRRWCGPLLALCVAAFELAFLLPVSARAGAPFNTPYPGWIAGLLALLAQLLVAGVVQARAARPQRARSGDATGAAWLLLASGAAAGLVFAVKPNAGLLTLAGALLALLPSWPARARGGAVLGWIVRLAALAGTVLLLGPAATDALYLIALAVPVLLAVLRAAPAGQGADVHPLRDGALLAAGFAVPTLAWAAPLLAELGAGRFVREVLLLDGGGVIEAYLLPFAPPDGAAVAVCVGVLVAAVMARQARARATAPRALRWLAPLALGGGVAVAAVSGSAAPARIVAEQVCLWLGPLALAAGLVLLPHDATTSRAHALLAFAALFALQLFPRPDLIHVAMGAPPVLVAIASAWSWLAEAPPWRPPRAPSRPVVVRVLAGAVLLLCAARAYPALQVRLTEPLVPLDAGPRAPLLIARAHAAEQRWLGETVRALAERSRPGEAVFYFPDLAGIGFLADRGSPFFYLYFVPGRPGPEGEQRTIDELEFLAPRLAVTGPPRVPAFAGAEAYFARLRAYLDEHYPPALALAACTVRERAAAACSPAADCTGPETR